MATVVHHCHSALSHCAHVFSFLPSFHRIFCHPTRPTEPLCDLMGSMTSLLPVLPLTPTPQLPSPPYCLPTHAPFHTAARNLSDCVSGNLFANTPQHCNCACAAHAPPLAVGTSLHRQPPAPLPTATPLARARIGRRAPVTPRRPFHRPPEHLTTPAPEPCPPAAHRPHFPFQFCVCPHCLPF